jgi:DNA-binding response OmpR family regulator
MKLLVVDDSSEIVDILYSAMELSGYEVDKAYNGVEALERLKNNSYDVVITDAEMPRMGGVEVCQFLKAQFSAIFVIGMSGCLRALKELKNAGADICFSKPFSIHAVEEAIEKRMFPSLPKFKELQTSADYQTAFH